jgi:hypothetical protein
VSQLAGQASGQSASIAGRFSRKAPGQARHGHSSPRFTKLARSEFGYTWRSNVSRWRSSSRRERQFDGMI